MRNLLLTAFIAVAASVGHAQMWDGVDTLYGNEWIDYGKTYFKIKVAEDGIYRVGHQALVASGVPVGSLQGSQFRLYRYGKQEPLYASTSSVFGPQDFLEFYGEKNRGQVDFFLFEDADSEQINPRHSIFNDTVVYYLCWESSGQGLRYSPVPNDLSNLPPKLPYCWSDMLQLTTNAAFKKRIDDEVTYSWFDGVGYTTAGSASENPVQLSLPGIYAQGPDAQMQVRYAGNLGQHHKRILFNDTLYAEDQFFNYRLLERNFVVPANRLKPNSTLKITSPIGDRHGLAFARIRYARDFHFAGNNSTFFSLNGSSSEQYIEIQGFNPGAGTAVLYDLTNKLRLGATVSGDLIQIKLPASMQDRKLLLANQTGTFQVAVLEPTQFQDFTAIPSDYVIISNSKLFQDPNAGGADRVAEYAAYRSSAAGGSYKPIVVDIEELYAQFAYGIRFHPIAIRNFLHWAKRQWPGLNHAFIIGKALDFQNFRSGAAQSSLIDSLYFVPNFSTPGTDLPFTMQGNSLATPIMAIGRLAVTKPQEIHDYLLKVKQHEQQLAIADQSIAGKAWMKRVIHNSGGLSGESGLIKNYTTALATTLETNRFGADIHAFYKTSDDPIQLSAYTQLLDLINNGVALWTIFGHSSAFAVDFDIGLPGSYNNYGRYPLMMVLGCFSGICSSPQKGIGEEFVLAPDRGAIAYIASVNYSFVDALQAYAQQYYAHMGGQDYGNSVGLTLAHTVRDLQNTSNKGLIAVLHQNLLQGDPAIRVHAHSGPDYIIDNQSFAVTPNPVSIQESEIKLTFDLLNIGENVGGQLVHKIEQRLPDDTQLLRLTDTTEAPAFRRRMETMLPLQGSKVGFNRYFIRLDPESTANENPLAATWNNSLLDANGAPGQEVYFYADDVSPVFPPDFGIVGKQPPTLFASTLNSNAGVFRYLFEIDTLESFDSPLITATQITQKGGLLAWKPNIPLVDSTVYYWRVARDSLVDGKPLWRHHSFIYLAQSPSGWNQSHFGQFEMDQMVNLNALPLLRKIEFQDNAAFVNVQIAYRGVNRYPGFKNAYYQGFYGDYGWGQQGISRGVALMVVDENSGRAVMNPANGPYNFNPQKERDFFWFDTRDSLERKKLMDFVENGVPDGFYVGLLAFNTPDDGIGYAPHLWAKDSITQGKNLFQVFENQGAQKIRAVTDFSAAPPAYGFVFRKGHPEYDNRDTIVRNTDATVELRADFLAKWALGFLESPVIGPVKAWKSLHWQHEPFDNNSDLASMSVLAVRAGQEDSLLLSLSTIFDTNLAQIPAAAFPFLKLRYQVSDTLTRTATQLKFARILYDALPEGALHPVAHVYFYKDTLQQGDFLHSSIAFANISEVPFDSVLLRFKVENQQNSGFEVQKRMQPLLPGDTLIAELSASTRTLSGSQRLVIEANPFEDQPELHHFNNVFLHDFFVRQDVQNPLLDVTFDGRHILNGDLVSPNPVVQISLKDENPYLAMRDSSTFSLKLVLPNGSSQVIASSNPDIQFYPADPTNLPKKNLARIEWRPTFLDDGTYQLIVNGRDASGNESAALDWSASFNIITKSSLSSLLNYPNPFSTSTCFVYTLTGATSPAHFRIQIMTVAGRVVREITEHEFGPLQPGTHRSNFCWDGKDTYGDQLANGVYLYRVVAKKADGSDFEHFENQSADGFFKHGFGKMVLMR